MTALLENLEAPEILEGAKPPHSLFHRGWSPPAPPSPPPLAKGPSASTRIKPVDGKAQTSMIMQ